MANEVRGLFVTGTGTEVGKTYVAALIARSLTASGRRVGVYKPVASGCRLEDGQTVADDAVALWQAAGRPGTLEQVCPQRFLAPLAPHLSAKAEGRRIDASLLHGGLDYWLANSDIVLVEGVGGLMSPLGEEEYVADLAAEFDYPLVVVSNNRLGTINATLQTLITATTYRDGLPIAGVVLNNAQPAGNDVSPSSNRAELAARCSVPLLAEVAFGAEGFDAEIDWYDWAL
ncbi:MAG: dethiobiotin synthase [Thermoguttaceae bacterium]